MPFKVNVNIFKSLVHLSLVIGVTNKKINARLKEKKVCADICFHSYIFYYKTFGCTQAGKSSFWYLKQM